MHYAPDPTTDRSEFWVQIQIVAGKCKRDTPSIDRFDVLLFTESESMSSCSKWKLYPTLTHYFNGHMNNMILANNDCRESKRHQIRTSNLCLAVCHALKGIFSELQYQGRQDAFTLLQEHAKLQYLKTVTQWQAIVAQISQGYAKKQPPWCIVIVSQNSMALSAMISKPMNKNANLNPTISHIICNIC